MAPKSVPVPMIRRVRLHNFRSIADCDVELGPLTILVGPNGSGKSNFLHALDFLADALNNGLETAVRRRGGMNSLLSRWALDDPDAMLSVEVELDLAEGRHGSYRLALRRTEAGGFRIDEERCRVTVVGSRSTADTFLVNDGKAVGVNRRGYRFDPSVDSRTGLTLPHHADHVSFGAVWRALSGVARYNLDVAALRRPQELDIGERLRADGSNVASVFDRLVDTDDHGSTPGARVVDWLSVFTPGIVDVETPLIEGYQALRFEQRLRDGERPHTFSAHEMSDGTLRMFGVLVALYQGRMRGGAPVTLVGIEEPESAVHPGAATAILEAMSEASLVTQVIATTHSAAMLDYDDDLDIDTLRGVASVNGRTIIGPIDAAGRQILEEQLYTAGELLRMGNLRPEGPSSNPVVRPVESPA